MTTPYKKIPKSDQKLVERYKKTFLTAFKTQEERTFSITDISMETVKTLLFNEEQIIAAIQKAPQFPKLPMGMSIHLDSGQTAKINKEGVAFTLAISKGSGTTDIAASQSTPLKIKKRAATAQEKADQDIVNNFKTKLLTTFDTEEKRTITIEKKNIIIQRLPGYSLQNYQQEDYQLSKIRTALWNKLQSLPIFSHAPDGVNIKLEPSYLDHVHIINGSAPFGFEITKRTAIALIRGYELDQEFRVKLRDQDYVDFTKDHILDFVDRAQKRIVTIISKADNSLKKRATEIIKVINNSLSKDPTFLYQQYRGYGGKLELKPGQTAQITTTGTPFALVMRYKGYEVEIPTNLKLPFIAKIAV